LKSRLKELGLWNSVFRVKNGCISGYFSRFYPLFLKCNIILGLAKLNIISVSVPNQGAAEPQRCRLHILATPSSLIFLGVDRQGDKHPYPIEEEQASPIRR
jgi:hypothetical protein